jgi:hypothetical protein
MLSPFESTGSAAFARNARILFSESTERRMPLMEKICFDCGKELRCVYTGCNVYLAHTGRVHHADLFACFFCATFHVYGFNINPLVAWKEIDGEKKYFTPDPHVVVAGEYLVRPYDELGGFAHVTGEVIPLPSAIKYMQEKCGHHREIENYLYSDRRRSQGVSRDS